MRSKISTYWIFLFLLVLGYGLFEYYRPVPTNWNSTYSNKDKIPFGTEVIYDLLPELVGNKSVETVRVPPYNLLDSSKMNEKSAYLFVKSEFNIDENDLNSLLDYVEKGNTVLVAAYDFAPEFLDTICVKAPRYPFTLKDTAKLVNFVNPAFKDRPRIAFPKDDGTNYLETEVPERTTVLAVNEKNDPVYIKLDYGKGQFLIHNLPLAFTNYYVLDSARNRHAFQALAYLPHQKIYWDEYQKQGRFGETQQSPFRYIVSTQGLKTAYILTLIGLALYAVFAGKRTQRIIPIQNPPQNISLEFVKTIGNMYFRKGNHTNMAEKLVQNFWIFIRDRFGVVHDKYGEDDLVKVLATKSDTSEEYMRGLLTSLNTSHPKTSASGLMDLNERLEDFYARVR